MYMNLNPLATAVVKLFQVGVEGKAIPSVGEKLNALGVKK